MIFSLAVLTSGLFTGTIWKLLTSGREPLSFFFVLVSSVIGAAVGSYLGQSVLSLNAGYNVPCFICSFVGALLSCLLYSFLIEKMVLKFKR